MSPFFAALIACAFIALTFIVFGLLPGWVRKYRRAEHSLLPHHAGHFAGVGERSEPAIGN